MTHRQSSIVQMNFKDIHARLCYLLTRVSASYGAAELSRRLSRHILDNTALKLGLGFTLGFKVKVKVKVSIGIRVS